MARCFNKWLLVLLPFLWVAGSAHTSGETVHPFYVSVTEINHNAAGKSLEISCRMFADDMEDALKKNFRTAVDLTSKLQEERSGGLIDQYMQKHLQVVANGRMVPLKFVGFEKENEWVYCYYEATGLPALKKLEVVNSVLHDFTPEQINIMHVTVGGRRQSTKLNFPAKNASFDF